MSGASGVADERASWVALASTVGIGDVTFARLLDHFGSASAAMAAARNVPPATGDREVASELGIRFRHGLARALRAATSDPRRAQRQMDRLGGWLLTPLDAGYPDGLHAIEEPPPVLYGLGDAGLLQHDRLVAVVGTRRPTAVARDLATRIGSRLVEARAVVVSGLAIGIDGAAHVAALETGGATVAVVAGGLDAPGPARHRRLAQRIIERGAVVAELPPGVPPTKGTFPRRNRIISGLAMATIVVEAPARSGALITARHALEQGRRLLVAPGRPLDSRIAGSLALLRESPARPLVGLDEMIVDLELDSRPASQAPADGGGLSRDSALDLLEPTQRRVARALAGGPHSVDTLCRATGLEPGVVAAGLTILQLRGWARIVGATHLPAGPLLALDKQGRA